MLDLGQSFATRTSPCSPPYQVPTWDSIPEANKDANGAWVNDYGGFVSIGCNAKPRAGLPDDVGRPCASPSTAGEVALNGDPTQSAAAFAGGLGGGAGQRRLAGGHRPGRRVWGELAKSGNLLKIDPTPATIQSGQTPIVLDWDYLNVTETEKNKANFDGRSRCRRTGSSRSTTPRRSTRTPRTPRPRGCGRSSSTPTRGQNLWLAGKARPVRLDAMTEAGTADPALLAALPPVAGEPQFPTQAQTDAAQQAVTQNWARATAWEVTITDRGRRP